MDMDMDMDAIMPEARRTRAMLACSPMLRRAEVVGTHYQNLASTGMQMLKLLAHRCDTGCSDTVDDQIAVRLRMVQRLHLADFGLPLEWPEEVPRHMAELADGGTVPVPEDLLVELCGHLWAAMHGEAYALPEINRLYADVRDILVSRSLKRKNEETRTT